MTNANIYSYLNDTSIKRAKLHFYTPGTTIARYQYEIKNSRGTEVLKARKTITDKKISQFDLLIEELTSQYWAVEEIACKQKVLDILLENVKKFNVMGNLEWVPT